MAKKKKEKANAHLKRFQAGNTWVTIVFIFFTMFMLIVFASLFAAAFFSYIADTKMTQEYETIKYMAEVYEKADADGYPDVFVLLDDGTRKYFVKDKNGNVLAQRGDNTCTNRRARLAVGSQGEYVTVYLDSVSDTLMYTLEQIDPEFDPDAGDGALGELSIDEKSVAKWMLSKEFDIKTITGGNANELPFWFCIDLSDGKQFFGRANLVANLKDGMFMVVFAAAMGMIFLAMFALMLVNLIRTIVSIKKMKSLFYTDAVTKDKNWSYFLVRGERILTHGKGKKSNYAVLDLVFVKYRNFCVCHSVEEGEELLRKVNKLVKGKINKKSELVTHYASANFSVLLNYTDEEQLKKRIDELVSTLTTMDPSHRFAFHVGVYLMPVKKGADGKAIRRRKNDFDLEIEYNNACTARATLEESDDSGIAYFDEELVEKQKWIDTVQEEQQYALDHEEFVVYYQPKYNPRTNRLRGAEALIRWNSPKHGFKPPSSIIPIFEKNGFIVNIDHYMLTHVARDQKRWLDAGLECVPVSVNVSRAHFIESDLAEQIRDNIDKEGCPRNLIEIELTESAFFDDKNAIIEAIKKLRSYGFMVSMDDFGSGYSSLNSLKDMPLDILKLDAGFFSGDLENWRGDVVVSEAIRLAGLLKMETVAEGVEFEKQKKFLADHGCDMIQGYVYAKPMPAEEYIKKLMNPVAEVAGEEEAEEETAAAVVEETAVEEVAVEVETTDVVETEAVGEERAVEEA